MTTLLLHYFLLASLFISQSSLWLAKADEALIEKTCRTTTNFGLCMRTTSQRADVRALATIITRKSKSSADDAHSFVLGPFYGSNPGLGNLLRQCVDLYNDSRTALEAALNSLGSMDIEGAESKYLVSVGVGY